MHFTEEESAHIFKELAQSRSYLNSLNPHVRLLPLEKRPLGDCNGEREPVKVIPLTTVPDTVERSRCILATR